MDINDTLNERETQYGSFSNNSRMAQLMKGYIRCGAKWASMDYDQQEAIDMICSKISRLLSGDPNHIDSWHDIAGYATLVADRLRSDYNQHHENSDDLT